MQARKLYGCAQPRAGGGFRYPAGKAGEADSQVKCQPGSGLVLIFQERSFQIARNLLSLSQRCSGAIIGDYSEKRVVMLSETIEACFGVVLALDQSQRDLTSGIAGGAVIGCAGD